MNSIHETVDLICPFLNKKKVQVDKKIAPLIKRMWELKLETMMSCEDNNPKDWIWICFTYPKTAEIFLRLILRNCPEDLAKRITRGNRNPFSRLHDVDKNNWKYHLCVDELKNKFFGFNLSVRFPQTDLKEVTNTLNDPDLDFLDLETFGKNGIFIPEWEG